MQSSHVVLNVPAVSCNHCKTAIENAVGALPGVERVDVDVAGKSVSLDYDASTVELETIEKTMADEGYEVAGRHVFGA
jgi:copper chaperone